MSNFISKAKEEKPFNNAGINVPFTGDLTVPVNPKNRENPDGSCKGAMTRGPSTIANPLTLQLDAAGRGSIAAYNPVVCDCYVPLNIPLLSLLGKLGRLGQLGGKFSRLARPLADGHNVLAMGMFLGVFGNLQDLIRWIRKTPKGKAINADEVLTRAEINKYLKRISDIDIEKFPVDLGFRNLAAQLKRAEEKMADIQGKLDRLNQQLGQPGADRLIIEQAIGALENFKLRQQNIINEILIKIQPLANKLDLLEGQRSEFQRLLDAAQLALVAVIARFAELVESTLTSDEAGVIFSAVGVPFDLLAALDAQRPKVCLGTNTRLNPDTCECECVGEAIECDTLPSFAWAVKLAGETVWDIFAPVQADELTECKLGCDCHLERGIPDCLCKYCEAGYTWKSGKACGCHRELRRTQNRRGRKLPLVESGNCIKDDVIAAQEAAGKSWDGTKSCSYICPEGSDVREGRTCGKFARLEDNLGNGAPSSSHYLYTTGCNCVCDGREANSSDMISPWPPVCPDDYIWDSSGTVCNCIPCPVKQYTCTASGSAGSCDDCPEGYICDPGDPENGISAGCSKTVEVDSPADCEALGIDPFTGMEWGSGYYCV